MIEIEPELELFLGIGLVRNEEYIGLYFNLTAWNITTQGIVQQTIDKVHFRWSVERKKELLVLMATIKNMNILMSFGYR